MKQEGRTVMKFDPQLHTLRSIANSIEDPRQRQEAQSARFNLFAALEQENSEEAKHWLDALDASIECATIPSAKLRKTAGDAINAIRRGL